MRNSCTALLIVAGFLAVAGAPPVAADDAVNPEATLKAFRAYFTKKFPKLALNDFVNGPYSMDADLRKQWEAIDDFPPYDFAVERGKQMFATPFKNGKTYADCFENGGIVIAGVGDRADTEPALVAGLLPLDRAWVDSSGAVRTKTYIQPGQLTAQVNLLPQPAGGGVGSTALLAVFAVLPRNLQRAISRSPQKSWTSTRSTDERTANRSLLFRCFRLFFAVL